MFGWLEKSQELVFECTTTLRIACLLKGNLYRTLEVHIGQASKKVNDIPREKFLASSDEDIFEYTKSELFVNALAIYEDAQTYKDEETQLQVPSGFGDRYVLIPGIRVTVSIPYTGDSTLWDLCPSQYTSRFPIGNIRKSRGGDDGYIDIVIEQRADEPQERIKADLDTNLHLIRDFLANQRLNVDVANTNLEPLIRQAIGERRNRLGKHESLGKILGIPLERKEWAPDLKPIVLEKRAIKPLPSTPKTLPDEYGIKDADYEHILNIIRHEGRTFETTPMTYKSMSENDLRNILLAHLNGHYRGGATGETFRGQGKTDIRIEFENRAAFVAECKIWRGDKEFLSAIDQMLGYLTWRDSKCALVTFNKDNAGFSEILVKILGLTRGHKSFEREGGAQELSEWRFVLTSVADPASHVTVQIFVFNLFCK